MACRVLLALLAAAAVATAVDASRLTPAGPARQLLQANNTRCPAGCDVGSGGCVLDATSGGYRCTRCLGALVINDADGTCGCPAGKYATTDDCADCLKGNWCAGGKYVEAGTPGQTACSADGLLTTLGQRSTSIKACVNNRGTYYTLDTNGNPGATSCPADSFSSGLKKQRACVPCPAGYTTNGKTGSFKASDCVVPPGYYLKGPGQVAPCPRGEYKAGFDTVASCIKCALGVTTEAQASTAQTACVVVQAGYYPANITSGYVATTQRCPQKYYCAGGKAIAEFTPGSPNPSPSTNTVAECPSGTWTQNIGATELGQCMTPPGHKTTGGGTTKCDVGEYRAEWKVPSQATACNKCGDGILSEEVDQITEYAITSDATPGVVNVSSSAAACFIKPGQGMYFSAASGTYKGVNCDTNNYGVANKTFGLAAFPCRDCPAGMQTSTGLANSNAYWSSDSASPLPHQGFTSPMACVTKAGFGYNGRVATKCPAGSFNAAGTYGTCTKCAVGLTTTENPDNQVSSSDCTIAKGYGFHDNIVQACPVGTYNDAQRPNTTAPCTPCGDGLTTSQAGGASADDCNVCAAGWGGTNCGAKCGGTAATYGPPGQTRGSDCVQCPNMTTGFSFDYLAANQAYSPLPVARLLADSAGDCLASFAQIVDSAWYLGGTANMANVTGVTTFDDCAADCANDATCQYITYNYDAPAGANKCTKKVKGTGGSDIIAFKAVVAGDTTAASKRKKATGKGLASGAYTFWKDSAAGIGTQAAATTRSVQDCLNDCDAAADCAAVVMTGLTSSSAMSTSVQCSLVTGDARVAQFKRSVTKADVARLTLADTASD